MRDAALIFQLLAIIVLVCWCSQLEREVKRAPDDAFAKTSELYWRQKADENNQAAFNNAMWKNQLVVNRELAKAIKGKP